MTTAADRTTAASAARTAAALRRELDLLRVDLDPTDPLGHVVRNLVECAAIAAEATAYDTGPGLAEAVAAARAAVVAASYAAQSRRPG